MGELTGVAQARYASIVYNQTVRHRFFAPDLSSPTVVLGESEAHHALHVLRLKADQPVELFDGRGRCALGRIATAGRREVVVAVDAVEGPAPAPLPRIHLAFAPPKGKRLDWLLEKAAELGAASLRMLICSRSVVEPAGGSAALARYQAICVSAVRQSRQVYLPEIVLPVEFADFLHQARQGAGILAHGGPHVPALAQLALPAGTADVTVLIGPEGGWTDQEIAQAEQAGFTPARLGHSTLRVETAAIAMIAAVHALLDTVPETASPCTSVYP
jgi:16S rRNA (uracil1498-N3)-methyltransferase